MAERSVSVKLTAKVDAYVAAMERAKAATGLPAASLTNLTKLGGQLQKVGGNLTRYVTVPLAAVGVGATKMAMEFEGAFANMVGLADAPASEIDRLRESVLDLAGETGRAPMELADALYAAMSSGLDAAEAMDAVDIAARGAAAGLGSSADIVSLVASATTSYADSNLTAAEAVDILTQTIREGRADPDELAGTLGRILPVAAELGVSFDQVGAATAYLSNVFGDTNRTVTAMSGLMLKLLSPTQQGRKALEDYGLSVEQLHAAIDERGLLGALELLRTSGLAGNSQALRAVFDDVEAFQGATALLGADVATLEGIFDNVADSTGAMGEAFSVVAETDGFKMRQALSEIQVAMIRVGDVLLPIAAEIGSAIADLVSWFSDLPAPVQQVVVAVGALAAAGGPVIWMAGTLLKNWQTLSTVLAGSSGAAGKASLALGKLGIIATTAAIAWKILGEGHAGVKIEFDRSSDALVRTTTAMLAEAAAAGVAANEVGGLELAHSALSSAIRENVGEDVQNALAALNVSTSETLGVLTRIRETGTTAFEGVKESARLAAQFFGITTDEGQALVELLQNGSYTTAQLADAFGVTEQSVIAFGGALQTVTDFAWEGQGAIEEMAQGFLNRVVEIGGGARQLVNDIERASGLNHAVAGDSIALYELVATALAGMTEEERANIGVTESMMSTISGLNPAAVEAALGLDEVGDSAGDMADKVSTASIDVRTAAERIGDAAEDFQGKWSSAIDSMLSDGMGLYDAEQQLWDVAQGFGEAIDNTSRSLETNSAEGRQNADALQEWARAIADHTTELINSGASAVDVANDYHHNREALLDNAEALGFNREEVESLLREWGLMPSLVSTTYNMAGIQTAQEQVQAMLEQIGEIPPDVAVDVQADINEGDYDAAIARLYALQNPITVPVRLDLTQARARAAVSQGGWGNVQVSMVKAATGAYVTQPTVALTGEAGREAIMPLTRPGRLDQMMSDPMSAPIWASMMRLMGAGIGGAEQRTIRVTERPIHVTVHNNGRQLTPADISRAIREAL